MIKYLVKQPNTQDQLVTNKKSPYIFNILAAPLNKKLVIFSHYLLIKSEEAIQSFIFFFISFFLYLFFSLFYLSVPDISLPSAPATFKFNKIKSALKVLITQLNHKENFFWTLHLGSHFASRG